MINIFENGNRNRYHLQVLMRVIINIWISFILYNAYLHIQ